LCKNEHDFATSTLTKTPCESSIPNFDHKRQCFLRDGEGMQEKINEKAIEGVSRNEGNGLALESNTSESKFIEL